MKRKNVANNGAAALVAALAMTPLAQPALAGAKVAVDENHWVSVGAGLRTSFNVVEDGAPSGDDPSRVLPICTVL